MREGLALTQSRSRSTATEALRCFVVLAGLGTGALAAGLAFNQSWAAATWPWPDDALSLAFVGSIWAAIAAMAVWTGAVGDLSVLAAGGQALMVMFAGISGYLFVRTGDGHVLRYAFAYGAVAVAGLGLSALGRRHLAVREGRPMPHMVRRFFIFTVLLLVAEGVALLSRVQDFPWQIDERSAVMFGCISIGSAWYFLQSSLKPRWPDARAALIALMAYDIALLPRYVQLPGNNNPYSPSGPINATHLVLYLGFIGVTGLFSLFYLFLAPGTRGWGARQREEPAEPPLIPASEAQL